MTKKEIVKFMASISSAKQSQGSSVKKVVYLKGSNPNPIITKEMKEEASKICSQEKLKGPSLFDLIPD